ncbi:2-C-methyl-D-erythritol 4-phosphate cytidylyltransferase [Piscibacillus halophilus]|uniref:2-C-methyl-D-erythritol 4-phosphate cytidylyltransferase n=1 Tax=Piscibacillus halophilus TaxID=571933 RepID=UPI0015890505|nr:2-C-methyl-D-erythritol 4-phosphate cytidylyltransferase [Piscibacillus halophilus]
MPDYQVIVLAAGQGRRMNAGKNKQLIEIGGQTLIEHTLQVFENDDWCDSIYVVVHPNEQKLMGDLIGKQFSKVKKIVNGGDERQDSVREGLLSLEQKLVTFVHDGARPFVTEDELHELYEQTIKHGAAFLGVPVTDTIKQIKDGKVQTLNRSELVAAQTPQAFTYDWLKKAHDYAYEHKIYATDDVALLEYLGHSPAFVHGKLSNFKITNPEDIQKAENMLKINRLDYK